MAALTLPLNNSLPPTLSSAPAQTNNLSLRLRKDEIFSLVSSYFSVRDCASLNLSCRDLRNRAEPLLWTPLAIRMGLSGVEASKQTIQEIMKLGVLTYLIFRTTKNIEQALNLRNPEPTSCQKWESFIKMTSELSQIRFNQVFSSKFGNTYLFHCLIHPANISVLKLIFTSFSDDQLNFLFNQTTDNGWTFLHVACRHNNADFLKSILELIPKNNLDNCLNPLTQELSPLLLSVANEWNFSAYQIVKHASAWQKIELLLTQKTKKQSLNFIQYLSVHGSSTFFTELLFAFNFDNRFIVLTASNNRPLFLAAINNRFDIVDAILSFILPEGQIYQDGFREIFEYIKNISDQPEALSLFKEVKKRLDKVLCYAPEDELCYKLTVHSGLSALIVKEPSPLTSYIISNYGSLISRKS